MVKAPRGWRHFASPTTTMAQIIRSTSSPNDSGPSPCDEGPLDGLCPVLPGVADGKRPSATKHKENQQLRDGCHTAVRSRLCSKSGGNGSHERIVTRDAPAERIKQACRGYRGADVNWPARSSPARQPWTGLPHLWLERSAVSDWRIADAPTPGRFVSQQHCAARASLLRRSRPERMR